MFLFAHGAPPRCCLVLPSRGCQMPDILPEVICNRQSRNNIDTAQRTQPYKDIKKFNASSRNTSWTVYPTLLNGSDIQHKLQRTTQNTKQSTQAFNTRKLYNIYLFFIRLFQISTPAAEFRDKILPRTSKENHVAPNAVLTYSKPIVNILLLATCIVLYSPARFPA